MGFFWNDAKPRVNEKEFSKAIGALMSKGFTKHEIDKVRMIFQGDLKEVSEREKGIDKSELERAVSWMRANMSKHGISENRIKMIEEEFLERI